MAACQPLTYESGFVSGVLNFTDCQAQNIGAGGYQALAAPGSTLSIVLTGLLTIFVALYGYRMLFGQTPNNPTANGHWVAISAGFSMAIASGMCGLAQAKAVAAAAEGMARNPGAAAAIRFALLLGLVLIESLALYTLVIIFVKVG